MATGDVIDFLEREGYDVDFIKTANRYLSYDSEHLILQCKNDILEFGEKEIGRASCRERVSIDV